MKQGNKKYVIFRTYLLLFLFFGGGMINGQTANKNPRIPGNFCIQSREMKLYEMINDYRVQYGLPPIPLSKSLCYVASLHVKDLFFNQPDKNGCNFHSWSAKGTWTPFCYPKDENKKNSVWDKPRELTGYPSRAYEIVYWENKPLVTDTIFMVWKSEDYFSSYLLNTGKWLGKPWNAIGIAVYETYACAWFGVDADPEGVVYVCGTQPVKPVKDTVASVSNLSHSPSDKPKKTSNGKKSVTGHDTIVKPSPGDPGNGNLMPISPATGNNGKTDSVQGIYYIIVKTSLPLEAARKLVEELKAGGYPDALVLDKDNKIRISVFSSTDKSIATRKLKEVKQTNYKDAWLLKR